MFGTIVAGTDGMAKGRGAVRVAETLARATGDRLLIAGVSPDPPAELPHVYEGDPGRLRSELELRVTRVRDELAPAASVRIQAGVSVAHGIRLVAEGERAGLVVVGAARRHGAARLLEGDHALQVMHGAPCAVLLVPEAEDVGAWAVDRVVVGLDETPEARAACALGAELARACGASLRLLAVVDDFPPTLGLGGYSVPLDWDEIIARAVEERGDMVRAAAERSRVAGAVAEVARGRPVDALVGASREADLLVLGSRRWGAVRRLALGSTTARVLREAHCPVLVPPRTADEPSAEPEAAEQATAG